MSVARGPAGENDHALQCIQRVEVIAVERANRDRQRLLDIGTVCCSAKPPGSELTPLVPTN